MAADNSELLKKMTKKILKMEQMMIDDDKTHHIEAGSAVEALPPPKACLSQV